MLSPDGHGYPDDCYGAFFSVGRDLIVLSGWDGLVDLNRFRDPDGRPEPNRWVASLDGEIRRQVEESLDA